MILSLPASGLYIHSPPPGFRLWPPRDGFIYPFRYWYPTACFRLRRQSCVGRELSWRRLVWPC